MAAAEAHAAGVEEQPPQLHTLERRESDDGWLLAAAGAEPPPLTPLQLAAARPECAYLLDVARHAAAVQLHTRSMAVAQMRAALVTPRGAGVRMPPESEERAGGLVASRRHQQLRQQQQQQQQPVTMKIIVAASGASPDAMDEDVAQTKAQQQQQQQVSPHPGPRQLHGRPLTRRMPDAAAAARFAADELSPAADAEAEGGRLDGTDGTGLPSARTVLHAPCLSADPALAGVQLAGWTRVAGPGGVPLVQEPGTGEANGDPGVGSTHQRGVDASALPGLDDELLGDAVGAGADDGGLLDDEEEWV